MADTDLAPVVTARRADTIERLQGMVSKGLGWARIFGTNAIAAYLVAEVLGDILTFQTGPNHSGNSITSWLIGLLLPTGIRPENLSLLWAILFCSACFIPIYCLYRKKIFLKI